ncbi:MAG: hypothetical protein ACUVUP_02440 [Thermaceae bacterium]
MEWKTALFPFWPGEPARAHPCGVLAYSAGVGCDFVERLPLKEGMVLDPKEVLGKAFGARNLRAKVRR